VGGVKIAHLPESFLNISIMANDRSKNNVRDLNMQFLNLELGIFKMKVPN